ncbi:MAG: hypothetical protein MI924_10505 [Chloroflexales bacterium]|nr:hypothetical protein [Chloroflexales bacterium]
MQQQPLLQLIAIGMILGIGLLTGLAFNPSLAPARQSQGPSIVRVSSFQSGGLGLTREAWEARYGAPLETMLGVTIYTGGLSVIYRNDKIWSITQVWETERTFDEARAMAKALLPADSTLVEMYTTSIGQRVDRSQSETLQYDFSGFGLGNEPGEHIVVYLHRPDTLNVTGFEISVGNNP